jgi:hypothetical protein
VAEDCMGRDFSCEMLRDTTCATPEISCDDEIVEDADRRKHAAQIGSCLLFIFVFEMPKLIDNYIIKLDNLYLTLIVSLPCFILITLLSAISYYILEKPWLKLRKRYVI